MHYPSPVVATWWLHATTGLPICWLFGEYDRGGNYEYEGDPDREAMYRAFVYDGTICRYYEGTLSDGLMYLDQVKIGVRRRSAEEERDFDELPFDDGKESGVVFAFVENGLHTATEEISSGDIYIATHVWWCRSVGMMRVEGLRAALEDYQIEIQPDRLIVSRRQP